MSTCSARATCRGRGRETDRRLNDKQIAWLDALAAKAAGVDRLQHGASSPAATPRARTGRHLGRRRRLDADHAGDAARSRFPLGVAAAVYLEEFAPKNRWTDLIEVNINNLAAVPSIIFGLLGLAVFLNFFGLPRSAPLVGGMMLALMTLPIIIIAGRAAIKAVPPSIREAALGVGASQAADRVPPCPAAGLPGILTGTIIGMARALGETAPLLMIGMVAFIVDIPQRLHRSPPPCCRCRSSLVRQSERGFVEQTAAAIIVLLVFLLVDERARHLPAQPVRRAGKEHERLTVDADHAGREAAADAPRSRRADVNVFYGDKQALIRRVDRHPAAQVTAFIGPSGCGKSTFLRCLNRMNDTIASCRVDRRDPARRRGHLRPRHGRGAAARPRRHGVPEAQPVSQVDLRERRLRPAHPRPRPRQGRAGRDRREDRCAAPACGTR